MTYNEFIRRFPTEESIIKYYVDVRYKGVLTCPHCNSKVKIYRFRKRPKYCQCNNCNNTFSVFSGTIFEKSRTSIQGWFFAINLFLNAKKGMSSLEMKRNIGVTKKCSWRMLKQIRLAMENTGFQESFKGIVELDEAFIGGKPRNRNVKSSTSLSNYGQGTEKTPIFGILEKETGRIFGKVMFPDEFGRRLSSEQLEAVFNEVCKEKVTVISDDYKGYCFLKKEAYKDYVHHIVNHGEGQYSKGNGIHINTIESFWNTFKKGFSGTYHKMSDKYLQKYFNEFSFRNNNRENDNMFELLLEQSILKDSTKTLRKLDKMMVLRDDNSKLMTYIEFKEIFPTEKSAIDFYIKHVYQNGLTCYYCKSNKKVYLCRTKRNPKIVHCQRCNNSHSLFKGTIN